MPKSPLERLKDIAEEADYLNRRRRDLTRDTFLGNEDLKRAFTRSLEIIGEASKKVPREFQLAHQELPWRLMAGMRDRLIHDYGGVDYEIVWQTVSDDVPNLLLLIQQIISQ
jgi:uncharacterized protein with HEPN domain